MQEVGFDLQPMRFAAPTFSQPQQPQQVQPPVDDGLQTLAQLAKLGLLPKTRKERQKEEEDRALKQLQVYGTVAHATGIPMAQLMAGNFSQPQGAGGIDPNQLDQIGQQVGLPAAPNQQIMAGMTAAGRDKLRMQLQAQADKELAKLETETSASAGTAQAAQRFLQLNEKTPTGGMYGLPGVDQLLRLINPDRQEMEAIRNQIAPSMRPTGSGSVSDFEQKMFQRATISPQSSLEANQNIGGAIMAKAKRDKERLNFLQTYADTYGTLRGADTAWSKYIDENPIFDPQAAQQGQVRVNSARPTWQEYFTRNRNGTARPPLSSFMR
jgi:hypothetical protein